MTSERGLRYNFVKAKSLFLIVGIIVGSYKKNYIQNSCVLNGMLKVECSAIYSKLCLSPLLHWATMVIGEKP